MFTFLISILPYIQPVFVPVLRYYQWICDCQLLCFFIACCTVVSLRTLNCLFDCFSFSADSSSLAHNCVVILYYHIYLCSDQVFDYIMMYYITFPANVAFCKSDYSFCCRLRPRMTFSFYSESWIISHQVHILKEKCHSSCVHSV